MVLILHHKCFAIFSSTLYFFLPVLVLGLCNFFHMQFDIEKKTRLVDSFSQLLVEFIWQPGLDWLWVMWNVIYL